MTKSTHTPKDDEPREEYFDNRPTGIEIEETSDEETEVSPWDPEQIRIHTKHFSLRQIVDEIEDGTIDLTPDFQRSFVWGDKQKSELIESLLLGIPLPSFYFSQEKDGRLQVVDGVQRLRTIYSYVRGKKKEEGKEKEEEVFAIQNVQYLTEVHGAWFDDLTPLFKRRLHQTQFVAHTIDPQTPYRVKFDIFKRINTGGTPLSPQEIRHCMSRERSRKFLKELSKNEHFLSATDDSLKEHPRMADREIALRFCAFRISSPEEYANFSSLDEFLGDITEKIDKQQISEEQLKQLEQDFSRGMHNCELVFGKYAFRKWPLGSKRRYPINRALFDSWGCSLADIPTEKVEAKNEELQRKARELMTNDQKFISTTFYNTGKPGSVKTRFRKVKQAIEEVLGC